MLRHRCLQIREFCRNRRKRRSLCCLVVVATVLLLVLLLATEGGRDKREEGPPGSFNSLDVDGHVYGFFRNVNNDNENELDLAGDSSQDISEAELEKRRKARQESEVATPLERYYEAKASAGIPPEARRSARCQDNSNCSIANGCLATLGGVCYDGDLSGLNPTAPSTFKYEPSLAKLKRHAPLGGTGNTELQCSYVNVAGRAQDGEEKGRAELEKDLAGGDPLPGFDSGNEDAENIVNAFKHVTGTPFDRWYDWQALIKPVASRNKFQMKGWHDTKDKHKIYRLENFCVRPSGRLTGYKPYSQGNVQRFRGGNDVSPFTADSTDLGTTSGAATTPPQSSFGSGVYAEYDELVANFISKPEELLQKPQWYVDQKIALMPMIGYHSVHPSHALQRIAALINNIEDAFPRTKDGATHSSQAGDAEQETTDAEAEADANPKPQGTSAASTPHEAEQLDWAREDVTTMFTNIFMPPWTKPRKPHPAYYPPYCGANCSWLDYGFKPYTTLATKSHFTTYNTNGQGLDLWRSLTEQSTGRVLSDADFSKVKQLLSTPVCFKEGIVYQSCYGPTCSSATDRSTLEERNEEEEQQGADGDGGFLDGWSQKDKGKETIKKVRSNGDSWPLFGYTHKRASRRVARRFRACAAVEYLEPTSDTRFNLEAPTVLHLAPSPPDSSQPQVMSSVLEPDAVLAPAIHKRIAQLLPKATVYYVDPTGLEFGEMVALFSSVDIVLGFNQPAGLSSLFMSLGFLCRPGAVGVQSDTVLNPLLAGGASGVDQFQDTSDFGALWRANEGHHIQVLVGEHSHRAPHAKRMILPKMALDAVDSAICSLHFTRNAAIQQRRLTINSVQHPNRTSYPTEGLRGACEFTAEDVESCEIHGHFDAGGDHLRRAIRMTIPQSHVETTPRLLLLHRHAPVVAKALTWQRLSTQKNLGLFFKCPSIGDAIEAARRDSTLPGKNILSAQQSFLTAVELELAFLRSHISRRNWIYLYLDKRCPRTTVQAVHFLVDRQYATTHARADLGGFEEDGSVVMCGRLDGASKTRPSDLNVPPKYDGAKYLMAINPQLLVNQTGAEGLTLAQTPRGPFPSRGPPPRDISQGGKKVGTTTASPAALKRQSLLSVGSTPDPCLHVPLDTVLADEAALSDPLASKWFKSRLPTSRAARGLSLLVFATSRTGIRIPLLPNGTREEE